MYGEIATADQNISGSSTYNFTPSDFTAQSGDGASGDAVLIRSIIHENDVTINRTGDPDADGTFEINQQISSRSGAGERHSDTLIVTADAGVEIVNDTSSAQNIKIIAEHVDPADVFVEQSAGIADASEITRTPSTGTDESVLEILAGASAELIRRTDTNDDGTYNMSATVETYGAPNVITKTWLSSVNTSGRTNPEMQTALRNISGGTADYMILGTKGKQ